MNATLDILFLRRPLLNYVSPPICDFIFSSTGFPVIVLNPLPHHLGPTGLALGGSGAFRLSWNAYPGALCYTIYQAVDPANPFGAYQIIAECITGTDYDLPGPGCYRISAITLDGESELSDPFCFDCANPAATTDSAEPGSTSAILSGSGTPNGFGAVAFFQWGTDEDYGNVTDSQDIGSGNDAIPCGAMLSGLTSSTTYHFRLVVETACGIEYGADQAFTTTGGGGDEIVEVEAVSDAENLGPIPGYFNVSRTGDASGSLDVSYSVSGTAVNGTDYVTISGTATILAGESNCAVSIVPLYLTTQTGIKDVTLTITPDITYVIGASNADTINLDGTTYNAPGSCFKPDSTSMGTQDLLAAFGSSITWSGMPMGSYHWYEVAGAFQWHADDCPLGFPDAWANVDINWSNTIGGSGMLPSQFDHNFAFDCGSGPGTESGFTSQALAEADYISRGTLEHFTFIDNLSNSSTVDATLSHLVTFFAGGDHPSLKLVRESQLVATQPLTATVTLDTFANGRFVISYNTVSTIPLTFSATALEVQNALNALSDIASDGGVTVTGDPVAGFVITWNNNGVRNLLVPQITTANPGIGCYPNQTQIGSPAQPEIQTLIVNQCGAFNSSADAEWAGDMDATRDLNLGKWVTTNRTGINSLNGISFKEASVQAHVDIDPLIVPSGKGWILKITGISTFFSIPATIWYGLKTDGDTPLGEYTWYEGDPFAFCSLNQTNGVRKLTVTGTF